jgi:hypothetical protein
MAAGGLLSSNIIKNGKHTMMRLARWASLLVAFYLVTSAATAYAECAWVLWGHDVAKDRLPHIWPVGAWESKEECQEQPLFRTQYPRKPDLEK